MRGHAQLRPRCWLDGLAPVSCPRGEGMHSKARRSPKGAPDRTFPRRHSTRPMTMNPQPPQPDGILHLEWERPLTLCTRSCSVLSPSQCPGSPLARQASALSSSPVPLCPCPAFPFSLSSSLLARDLSPTMSSSFPPRIFQILFPLLYVIPSFFP